MAPRIGDRMASWWKLNWAPVSAATLGAMAILSEALLAVEERENESNEAKESQDEAA